MVPQDSKKVFLRPGPVSLREPTDVLPEWAAVPVLRRQRTAGVLPDKRN